MCSEKTPVSIVMVEITPEPSKSVHDSSHSFDSVRDDNLHHGALRKLPSVGLQSLFAPPATTVNSLTSSDSFGVTKGTEVDVSPYTPPIHLTSNTSVKRSDVFNDRPHEFPDNSRQVTPLTLLSHTSSDLRFLKHGQFTTGAELSHCTRATQLSHSPHPPSRVRRNPSLPLPTDSHQPTVLPQFSHSRSALSSHSRRSHLLPHGSTSSGVTSLGPFHNKNVNQRIFHPSLTADDVGLQGSTRSVGDQESLKRDGSLTDLTARDMTQPCHSGSFSSATLRRSKTHSPSSLQASQPHLTCEFPDPWRSGRRIHRNKLPSHFTRRSHSPRGESGGNRCETGATYAHYGSIL
eukprot:GHVN01077557.1.p1 GENE.GHVN01077557.1~~GHVN01077557.1.p1  ORF type:complete len:348 (-),score=73.95 GHVN01077557.1:326-1369(-)